MATFKPVVLKHHKKSDGSYSAKIRISQKGKSAYLDTHVIITKNDLDSKLNIKRNVQIEKFSHILKECYDCLTPELSSNGDVQHIKQKIQSAKDAVRVEFIDFLEVCDKIVAETKEFSKNSAIPLNTVVNSLRDFVASRSKGRPSIIGPTDITSAFLKEYEKYLRSPRKLIRLNQFGNPVVTKSEPLSDSGVFKHMANLRLLFNTCRAFYNDEDIGKIIIPNNPFAKYKISAVRREIKRALSITELVSLYRVEPTGVRERLAWDMFFLSFFLCGMNSVDIYNYNDQIKVVDGRLSYNRSKTKGKRSDKALISIRVYPLAEDILSRYSKKLRKRFSDDRTFCTALNKGLKVLAEKAGIGRVTFYFARHTFATIARNDCRCSKDDIAEALNHVDTDLKVTDNYIAKDWQIVDDVQRKVLQLFFKKLDELV